VNYIRNVYKYYVAYKLSETHTDSVADGAHQWLPNNRQRATRGEQYVFRRDL
jgi:hypothetical protein